MADRIVAWCCAVLALVSLAIPTGRPQVVIVKERWAPLTQWTCSAQEHAEREFACTHRVRSTRIGAR